MARSPLAAMRHLRDVGGRGSKGYSPDCNSNNPKETVLEPNNFSGQTQRKAFGIFACKPKTHKTHRHTHTHCWNAEKWTTLSLSSWSSTHLLAPCIQLQMDRFLDSSTHNNNTHRMSEKQKTWCSRKEKENKVSRGESGGPIGDFGLGLHPSLLTARLDCTADCHAGATAAALCLCCLCTRVVGFVLWGSHLFSHFLSFLSFGSSLSSFASLFHISLSSTRTGTWSRKREPTIR